MAVLAAIIVQHCQAHCLALHIAPTIKPDKFLFAIGGLFAFQTNFWRRYLRPFHAPSAARPDQTVAQPARAGKACIKSGTPEGWHIVRHTAWPYTSRRPSSRINFSLQSEDCLPSKQISGGAIFAPFDALSAARRDQTVNRPQKPRKRLVFSTENSTNRMISRGPERNFHFLGKR
jgi:hypothetical protein